MAESNNSLITSVVLRKAQKLVKSQWMTIIQEIQNYFQIKWYEIYNSLQHFYNVKNGSSIITSKSSSKNLSNVIFKAKHGLKCQFSGNTSPLLRFVDEHFDVIFDNPILTLVVSLDLRNSKIGRKVP
jgi:hypothetical protein